MAATLVGQSLGADGPLFEGQDRISTRDWSIGAALLTSHGKRDVVLLAASLAFIAFNVYLWTLPIPQTQLFYISAPLGFGFLVALIWWIGRDPE